MKKLKFEISFTPSGFKEIRISKFEFGAKAISSFLDKSFPLLKITFLQKLDEF